MLAKLVHRLKELMLNFDVIYTTRKFKPYATGVSTKKRANLINDRLPEPNSPSEVTPAGSARTFELSAPPAASSA